MIRAQEWRKKRTVSCMLLMQHFTVPSLTCSGCSHHWELTSCRDHKTGLHLKPMGWAFCPVGLLCWSQGVRMLQGQCGEKGNGAWLAPHGVNLKKLILPSFLSWMNYLQRRSCGFLDGGTMESNNQGHIAVASCLIKYLCILPKPPSCSLSQKSEHRRETSVWETTITAACSSLPPLSGPSLWLPSVSEARQAGPCHSISDTSLGKPQNIGDKIWALEADTPEFKFQLWLSVPVQPWETFTLCINNSLTLINISFLSQELSLLYIEICNATKSKKVIKMEVREEGHHNQGDRLLSGVLEQADQAPSSSRFLQEVKASLNSSAFWMLNNTFLSSIFIVNLQAGVDAWLAYSGGFGIWRLMIRC